LKRNERHERCRENAVEKVHWGRRNVGPTLQRARGE
jgi:hypothetical protein